MIPASWQPAASSETVNIPLDRPRSDIAGLLSNSRSKRTRA